MTRPHLTAAHGLTAAEYRRRHQLPAGLSLQPTGLRATRSRIAQTRHQQNPEQLAAAKRKVNDTERMRRAQQAKQDSRTRAGTQAAARRQAEALGQRRRAEGRRRHDQRVRELGYTDIEHLIADTSHLTCVPQLRVDIVRKSGA